MNELDIGYIAGIIDGEGCIHVRKYKGTPSRFSLVMSVCMTSKEVITYLHKKCGGTLTPRKHQKGRKPVWLWSAHGAEAVSVLECILPSLIEKREQALLAIKFFNNNRYMCPDTDDERKSKEVIYWKMRELKNA